MKPPTRAPDPLVSDVDMKTVDPTDRAVGGVKVPHPKQGVRLVPTSRVLLDDGRFIAEGSLGGSVCGIVGGGRVSQTAGREGRSMFQ